MWQSIQQAIHNQIISNGQKNSKDLPSNRRKIVALPNAFTKLTIYSKWRNLSELSKQYAFRQSKRLALMMNIFALLTSPMIIRFFINNDIVCSSVTTIKVLISHICFFVVVVRITWGRQLRFIPRKLCRTVDWCYSLIIIWFFFIGLLPSGIIICMTTF